MTTAELITWLAACQHNATTFSVKNLVDQGKFDDIGGCYIPPDVVAKWAVHIVNPEDMRSFAEKAVDNQITAVFYKDVIEHVRTEVESLQKQVMQLQRENLELKDAHQPGRTWQE